MADWFVAAGKQYDMQPPWQLRKDNKYENGPTVDANLEMVLLAAGRKDVPGCG